MIRAKHLIQFSLIPINGVENKGTFYHRNRFAYNKMTSKLNDNWLTEKPDSDWSHALLLLLLLLQKVVHLNPVILDANGSWSCLRGGGKGAISCESNFDFLLRKRGRDREREG